LNSQLATDEPAYDYGIIVCAMRYFTPAFSPYYREFAQRNSDLSPAESTRKASAELAQIAVALRESSTAQIVGFDLAGAENGFPASDHIEAFSVIGKGLLGKTVHAGEAFGAESIFQAVTKLHTNRIGHGLHLFDTERLQDPEITDRNAYVENLANFIAKHRITIEVCLTSNMQTTPEIAQLQDHSLRRMLERGLSITLCTDNRLVSNTTVCREYQLALAHFPIDSLTLRNIVLHGFKRSFYYHPYTDKAAYLKKVISYYDALADRFGIH
jgi:adenosine deaminase